MKALSVRQLWAWAIIYAGKDIENRSWRTNFRGRVLIHAGKTMTRREYWHSRDEIVAILQKAGIPKDAGGSLDIPAFGDVERGGVIGSVEIVDCVSESDSPWFCGPCGLVLRDPKPLPFRPVRGRLGFFEVPQVRDKPLPFRSVPERLGFFEVPQA